MSFQEMKKQPAEVRRQAAMEAASRAGAVHTARELQKHKEELAARMREQAEAARLAREEMVERARGRNKAQELAKARPAKDGKAEWIEAGELSGEALEEHFADMVAHSQRKSCRGLAHFARDFSDRLAVSGENGQMDNAALSAMLVGMLSHIDRLERQQAQLIEHHRRQSKALAQLSKALSKADASHSVFDSAGS